MDYRDHKLYDVLQGYCVTEKASLASSTLLRYTFKVSARASKFSVKRAVEEIFDVKVLSVNVVNVPSKVRVFRGRKGVKPGFKKAIVKVDKKLDIDGTS